MEHESFKLFGNVDEEFLEKLDRCCQELAFDMLMEEKLEATHKEISTILKLVDNQNREKLFNAAPLKKIKTGGEK